MILFVLVLIAVLAPTAHAQTSNPQIKYVTTAPSGACGKNNIDLKTPDGDVYTCHNGTWRLTASGGGGGGAAPAGVPPQLQSNGGGGTFAAVANNYIRQFLMPIADPSAPAVSAVPGGATTWGYKVVVFNGVGWTLPSSETTVTNGTLNFGMGIHNDITLPTIVDASCIIVRTTGPGAPYLITPSQPYRLCDGSVVNDYSGTLGPSDVTLPSFNSTAGILVGSFLGIATDSDGSGNPDMIFGGLIPDNSQAVKILQYTQDIGATDVFGNQTTACGPDAATRSWFCQGPFRAPTLQTQNTYTVMNLPTCVSGQEGLRASVSDATLSFTAGIGTVVMGGMGNHVPVYCDGTNWRIG